jgi:hypothetical protein
MILYLKDQEKSTENLLTFDKHLFSKLTGHKINLQKSVHFLYPNNEQTEK